LNKTNAINQTVIKSTTAILVSLIHYEPPITDSKTGQETTPRKHILDLENISLVSSNSQSKSNAQTLNLPWINNSPSRTNRLFEKLL